MPTTPLSYMTVSNWITAQVISLWWYNLQYCVHCLPCRPNRPLPKPAYEYEYIDSESGGVALAKNLTWQRTSPTQQQMKWWAHALPLPLRRTRRCNQGFLQCCFGYPWSTSTIECDCVSYKKCWSLWGHQNCPVRFDMLIRMDFLCVGKDIQSFTTEILQLPPFRAYCYCTIMQSAVAGVPD